MFLPLKVTTDYSLLESMITIPKLTAFLKKYQINVCGICDKNLFGVIEFYDTMLQNEIKPIIGLEVTSDIGVLYLYARNYEGYQSLLKMSSNPQKTNISFLDIVNDEKNLNVILPYSLFQKYSELKNSISHLYIGYETENEWANANLLTPNVLFCPNLKSFSIEESQYLSYLKAIDYGESIKLIQESNQHFAIEFYMNEQFPQDKTQEFIESCNVVIPKENNYIPKFLNDVNSASYLTALAQKGLMKRFSGKVSKKTVERLKYELSVVNQMGFSDYFLIVYDYVKFAKQHGILVGAGRGSAVGSLVSYSLGITDVNPLEYNLLFERFLNPERITMPDIDIDFEETRRDEVISYVKSRYGEKNVANIITFGTLKSKLVLRSVGKSLEMNENVLESFVNKIDAKLTLKENLQNKDIDYYVKHNEEIKKLMQVSMQIEGLKKHISTHAAGVVISSVPLESVIPIYYNGQELLTGVTMNYLEELGLLKMDFLSLRNLSIMGNVLNLIAENTKKKLEINKIPLNDSKVLQLFTEASTVGIFQFESEGMKSFLRKLKPTCFLDLVAAIALYRPGPMENIDTYIKRKEGREKITYLHEDLKPILEETYGIIVYQEQIMQILVKIGGFSFSEADTIRRAMSKKKKEVIMTAEEKFLERAAKEGYDLEISKTIYQMILKFANYGFNKSHSVSYALIGYQMAYLKAYYPIFYLANLLNMNVGSLEKTKEYISLAKRQGITILPPSINESLHTYKINGNTLRLPFELIKGLGIEATKTIIEKRGEKPYVDFFDFVKRTSSRSITRKTLECLIDASVFDLFCDNHNTLKKNIEIALNYAVLAADIDEEYIEKPRLEIAQKETQEERRKMEYAMFGFYISNHPSSRYIDASMMKLENIKEYYNKHITCVVLVERIKTLKTKNGDDMAFLTASDETDTGNFVVFASVMKDMREIQIGDLVCIQGRIARRFLEYQINVNKIEKMNGGKE